MLLSKNFEYPPAEKKWYRHWLNKNYFHSEPDTREPYTVVIPPPNVTGVLHMGHTLNETVQDILIRKARMSGFNACWVPGSDHASIATEAKVVQMLKEKGIDKNTLSREEFLRYAFEWKEKYGNIIYNQIERLGCSVDWSRVSFTMDPDYYNAVIKIFITLYNKGLIYRGARMINWDPAAKTALSDEEVEYKEVKGKLYYIKYNTLNNDGTDTGNPLIIATQRPETIMGDTAVCVHPGDERYKDLIGKQAVVPLINEPVKIIADEYVDPSFGTGVLKVTPAHDINDYNLGLKYNLRIVDTLNEDGTLSEAAKIFTGMDRFAARKKIIEQLKEQNLLVKEEEYSTRLGYSQRTNAVVEPRISTQWFVKMKELAGPALKEVTEGRIKIHPGDKFSATYKYWLENVKDWCISRQLWWGQRIPAWYDEEGRFVVASAEEEAKEIFNSKYSIANARLKQDEDVLDTWFSSWLWPIEVFKGITHPGNKDFKYYYPTSVLVTGQDIIFFWVARMIMAGMEFKNEKPFSDVYFTGMVRDKQGRKMSKSLGNSPDLLELIDKYGADAVRFGIMISSPAGNDLLFDEGSLEQGRNFNNKLWNALRLVKMWEERQAMGQSPFTAENFGVDWFENRLNETRAAIEELYKEFKLSEILKTVYSLIWDDFCSWYLEWIKPPMNESIEKEVYEKTIVFFEELIQLLHPFMPFITEEIYHQLRERKEGDDLVIKQQAKIEALQPEILEQAEWLKADITAIRDARKKNEIKNSEKIQFTGNQSVRLFYSQNTGITELLTKQTNTEYNEAGNRSETSEVSKNEIIVNSGKRTFFLAVEKNVDAAAQKEQLQKDLDYLKGFLTSVEKKLGNEKFVQNAKPEIIETERKKKADAEVKIKMIEENLKTLG